MPSHIDFWCFPPSLDLIPRLSQGEETMLLIAPTLKSWSLLMLCEITSFLIIAVILEGWHIYFNWKLLLLKCPYCLSSCTYCWNQFVLYIPWWLQLWLPNLQHCLSAPFPCPSASSFWSTSLTLCAFPKLHSEDPSFSLLQPNPQNRPEADPQ